SILEAQGKKQAIELLNSSNISNEVLNLKAIEQLGILANGNSTKIILPPNLSSIASTMVTAAEIFKEETKDK
ncbi:peptidase, partial [Mycoplasmopsis pullorum]